MTRMTKKHGSIIFCQPESGPLGSMSLLNLLSAQASLSEGNKGTVRVFATT